jgi:hypothetical protein
MTESLEELQQLHSRWVEQKYTQTFIKNLKEEMKQAWIHLKTACSNTSDPKVMYAFSRWYMISQCLEDITKGPGNAEQVEG